MKTISKALLVALALAVPVAMYSQWDMENLEIDRTKWKDYTPQWNPNYNLMIPGAGVDGKPLSRPSATQGYGTRNLQQSNDALPEYWDNGKTIHFPPVFNQAGGSCGVSSRVGYMLTEELNAYRGTNASLDENRMACNFQYPFSYDNGTPKNYMAQFVGYPDAKTYGGFPYSSVYGFYEVNAYNAGWMQGYDKWYTSMHNRIWGTSSIPVGVIGYPENNTEGWGRGGYGAGALAAKRYLYNHNGDESYYTGGLLGLGVACGGPQFNVPKTAANDAAGVTGKRYWVTGTSVDHAVTITGYDDRIEFDLDGNGIAGERNNTVGQDEKGAWIIVNSWGGWANNGFIYIPYALAAPTCKKNTKWYYTYDEDGVTKTDSVSKEYYTPNGAGGFTPEIYTIRKDYTPGRTVKLKMTFNQRSAISLRAGIARNLNANEPEKTITFHHFNYQGNGNNSDDPLIPMLGRWNDGRLHYEPMEFGYDLTDLTEDFDKSQPLKYFFIIVSNSTATGVGGIHAASIMDYTYDPEGVEIPFTIEDDSVSIQNGGKRTMISVIVNGSGITPPTNVSLTDGTLIWDAPVGSLPSAYKVYADDQELAEVKTTSYSFTPEEGIAYTVRAVFGSGEGQQLSAASSVVKKPVASDNVIDDYVGVFENGGFSIPDIFSSGMAQATIEFRMKPTKLVNWNQQIGPNWGEFLVHTTSAGELVYGWNTGNDRSTVTSVLKTTAWTSIAITVDGSTMTLYVNGIKKNSFTSSNFSGVPSLSELVFGSHQGSDYGLYGYVDEVRIWKGIRTANQIRRTYSSALLNPTQFNDLLAYYRMDTIVEDGETKLRDCVGGHHASFVTEKGTASVSTSIGSGFTTPTLVANITRPTGTTVGQAYTFTDYSPSTVVKREWVIDGKTYNVAAPTIVFNEEGVKDIQLTVTDHEGNTAVATSTITVEAANITPTAAFHLSSESISGNDRVSFISENTAPGCTYLWEMPGAIVEQASTINAAAQYTAEGTYNIKLTVTGPDGAKYTEQHQVIVVPSAPIARYNISENVVLKGQEVELNDNSLYSPTGGSWIFSSDQKVFATFGLHTTVTPTVAGVYDLTYKVANEHGSNEVSQGRALVVCNAESKQGLNFGGGAQKLTANAPADITSAWTIGFWYRPMGSGVNALCITGGTGGLTLRSNDSGGLTLTAGEASISSSSDILETNAWHHYAVTANRGVIRFYTDGVLTGSGTLSGVTDYSTLWNGLTIGGEGTETTGVMDELWIFNKNLTNTRIKTYCVLPITEALNTEDTDALKLYYDFNHSTGDAEDKSGSNNTGVRTGFGPDGDAWVDSKGVFALNFSTTQSITPLGEAIKTGDKYTVIAWSDQETVKETAPASNALDGKSATFWHSSYSSGNVGYPHSITIQRNDITDIETVRFQYTRAQNYRASQVTIEASEDGENWNVIETETTLPNAENQYVFLAQPIQEPYIRITFTKGFGGTFIALNEITFYGGLIATGIETLEEVRPNMQNNVWYDLQGRRVTKPERGIYIVNGKKVFVK